MVAALEGLLADSSLVTGLAAVALVGLEAVLRVTGFARPDTVNLDLEDR